MELDSTLDGTGAPLGDIDLELGGVDVDAKSEETDTLDAR